MKKLILTILLLTTTVVVCDAQFVTSTMNSIVTITPIQKLTPDSSVNTNNSIIQVDYFDGLGRPVQTVQVHGSSSDTDLATRQVYDKYGQVIENWLPVPAPRNYGAYVSSFDSKSKSAYSNDSRAYTKTEYEPSPLARPVAVYSPGTEMATHPTTIKYSTNSENEVIKYAMSGENIVRSGNYQPGTLFVQIDADQDGCTTKTFTDKLGNLILERRINGNEQYDTYYVYSNFGSNTKKYNHTNLCAVLPPGCNESNYADAAYIYRYDDRHRCIYKKIPGADYVTYVYDNADRLTYSQDGEQRKCGKYTYYVYDQFSRVTSQGECNDTKGNGKTCLVFYSYDNYQFLQDPRCSGLKSGTGNVKGLKTGAIISVLGSPSGVQCEVYSYDYRGRLEKTMVKDVYGKLATYTTDYNFNNQPIQRKEEYSAQGITKTTTYTYDLQGRLTKEYTTVTVSKTTQATAQVEFVYSNVGRLGSKKIGTTTKTEINYQYNTQGQLLSAMATDTKTSNSIFTETLYYNTYPDSRAKKYYNGNISAIYWKHSGQSANTTIFGYDKLNRLVNSTMLVGTPYTETGFLYDERGNISGFTRYDASSQPTRYYLQHSNANRLVIANTDKGQFWGFNYDANGNQTLSPNGLTITYNSINQPQQVKSGSTVKQKFAYLADGRKLHSISDPANDGGLAYIGTSVFNIGRGNYTSFESTSFSAGRIVRNSSGAYAVQYHITDHLGSVRVVLNQSMTILEQNDYYPFGLRHPNSALKTTANRYRYNGKEEIAADATSDYGARQYSAEFCQWLQLDPLAEKRYGISAYNFCSGNPINRIDPDGRDDYGLNSKGEIFFIKATDDEKDRLYSGVYQKKNGEVKGLRTRKDGSVKNKSIEISKGPLNPSKKEGDSDRYSFSNVTDATNFFEFCASNSNVEWGFIEMKSEGSGQSNSAIVTTSRKWDQEQLSSTLTLNYADGIDIVKHVHSHPIDNEVSPNINSQPSVLDKNFRDRVLKKAKNKNIQFYIFNRGNYRNYTNEMSINWILLLLLLFPSIFCYGQSSKLDSLAADIEKNKDEYTFKNLKLKQQLRNEQYKVNSTTLDSIVFYLSKYSIKNQHLKQQLQFIYNEYCEVYNHPCRYMFIQRTSQSYNVDCCMFGYCGPYNWMGYSDFLGSIIIWNGGYTQKGLRRINKDIELIKPSEENTINFYFTKERRYVDSNYMSFSFCNKCYKLYSVAIGYQYALDSYLKPCDCYKK